MVYFLQALDSAGIIFSIVNNVDSFVQLFLISNSSGQHGYKS